MFRKPQTPCDYQVVFSGYSSIHWFDLPSITATTVTKRQARARELKLRPAANALYANEPLLQSLCKRAIVVPCIALSHQVTIVPLTAAKARALLEIAVRMARYTVG